MPLEELPPLSRGTQAVHAPGCGLRSVPTHSLRPCASTLLKLNLCHNQLASLPDELGTLRKLQELLLSCNRLESLPPSCAGLKRLLVLSLSCNRLEAIPEPALDMTELQWLWLGGNRIDALPPTLPRLGRLQSLLLNDNRLTSLAAPLPDSLLELDISHNLVTEIAHDFAIPNGAEVTAA